MPLRRTMNYQGRTPKERAPHQIATALATVVEAYSRATGTEINVGEHEDLDRALMEAGQAIFDAFQPNA